MRACRHGTEKVENIVKRDYTSRTFPTALNSLRNRLNYFANIHFALFFINNELLKGIYEATRNP